MASTNWFEWLAMRITGPERGKFSVPTTATSRKNSRMAFVAEDVRGQRDGRTRGHVGARSLAIDYLSSTGPVRQHRSNNMAPYLGSSLRDKPLQSSRDARDPQLHSQNFRAEVAK